MITWDEYMHRVAIAAGCWSASCVGSLDMAAVLIRISARNDP